MAKPDSQAVHDTVFPFIVGGMAVGFVSLLVLVRFLKEDGIAVRACCARSATDYAELN